MEIFGSSSPTPAAPATAPAPQKSAVDDILSLFGNSSSPTPAAAAAPSQPPAMARGSLFDLGDISSPAPTPAPAPAPAPKPQLTSYTAYEKNDLKITLTPQTNPTKPGLVLILARFQVSGITPATGISFQAAVPKVRRFPDFLLTNLTLFSSDTTTSNVTDHQRGRLSWCDGVPADACYGSTRGTCPFVKALLWLTVRSFFRSFSQSQVRLRLRISYNVAGQSFLDQVDFSGFPPGLTGGN
jgi:AP-1 complex subunit gamma-1